MARDYKNASTTKSRKKGERPVGSWISFLSGLALGLLVAFFVFVWCDRVSEVDTTKIFEPFDQSTFDDETALIEDAADLSIDDTPTPKFDFYNILPELEVKVPDWEIDRSINEEPNNFEKGTYVMQVGSFKQHQDADRAKAELALNGMQAKIHRVVINGQDVWYRVHLGPFQTLDQIQKMRRKLLEAKRDFIVLRIGEG